MQNTFNYVKQKLLGFFFKLKGINDIVFTLMYSLHSFNAFKLFRASQTDAALFY